MECTLCKRPAKEREPFYALGWEKVDKKEFEARKEDGRTIWISEVCPDCMLKHNDGRPPLGLADINEMRRLGITNEEYYKKHGY